MSNIYFYLINYRGGNYHEILADKSFIQIKGNATNINEAVILTFEKINIPASMEELSQQSAQELLNNWIDIENSNPESQHQDYINLTAYIEAYSHG